MYRHRHRRRRRLRRHGTSYCLRISEREYTVDCKYAVGTCVYIYIVYTTYNTSSLCLNKKKREEYAPNNLDHKYVFRQPIVMR